MISMNRSGTGCDKVFVSWWVRLAARLLLAGVWLVAGGTKVSDLQGSVRAVHAYDLLPYDVSKVVGAALPFVEIAVGVLLVAGFATPGTGRWTDWPPVTRRA